MTNEFLKRNPNILVLKADKGHATVLMDRKEYKEKILSMLEEKSTYKKLQRNPTSTIEAKCNDFFRQMFEKKYIDFPLKKSFTHYDSVAPKFYGLPKLHKNGVPLRPVTSYVKAPTASLSRFLANILQNIRNDDMNIPSAQVLKERISDLRLDDDHIMVSFDAVSLFTSIPASLTIQLIKKRWVDLKNIWTGIDEELFFKMLTYCLEKGYCQFDGSYYSQIEGLPMGSPLSPVLADIVLDELFILTKQHFQDSIIFMTKYVDDSLFIIKQSIFDNLFNFLNNFHQRIAFTYEKEQNSCINLLDITILRTPNGLTFKHFQKSTYTGRLINFYSNQPFSCKFNTCVNLLERQKKLSDPNFHDEIISKFSDTLKANNYPVKFINDVLNFRHKNNDHEHNNSSNLYFSLPFIGPSSHIIKKSLSSLDNKIRISFGSHNTMYQKLFSKTKDKIPPLLNSGVVYKIPCSSCPLVYVGETSQLLKKRISQHKNDVKEGNGVTALAQHTFDTTHVFDFNRADIVARENNNKKRQIFEVINIIRNNTVNFKTDTNGFSCVYKTILNHT